LLRIKSTRWRRARTQTVELTIVCPTGLCIVPGIASDELASFSREELNAEGYMRWSVFHHLDGGWQWECADEHGNIVASGKGFKTHAECVEDAMRHGYIPGGSDNGTPDKAGSI
jgi:hypothetical protein